MPYVPSQNILKKKNTAAFKNWDVFWPPYNHIVPIKYFSIELYPT